MAPALRTVPANILLSEICLHSPYFRVVQMSNRKTCNKIEYFVIVTLMIFVTTTWSCIDKIHLYTQEFQTDKNANRMETEADKDSTCYSETCYKGDITSVHSDQIHEVHNVPMEVLIRPFPSVLDESKVNSLMDTIKVT